MTHCALRVIGILLLGMPAACRSRPEPSSRPVTDTQLAGLVAQAKAWSHDETKAYRALVALREMGPEARSAVPTLLEILHQEYVPSNLHTLTVQVLGAIGPGASEATSYLCELLASEDDELSLIVYAQALGDIHDPRAADALRRAMAHPYARVRRAAEEAYKKLPGTPATSSDVLVATRLRALSEQLRDPDSGVRSRAAGELAGFGKAAADVMPELLACIDDTDWMVRYPVVVALGQIGKSDAAVVKGLAARLKDESGTVQMQAAIALGKIGPGAEAAVPALEAAEKRGDEGLKKYAKWAIEQIRGNPTSSSEPKPSTTPGTG